LGGRLFTRTGARSPISGSTTRDPSEFLEGVSDFRALKYQNAKREDGQN